jgi:hypothetical protein
MDMTEGSKADEAALELVKQLIALASGVLALTAAFLDKLPKVPLCFLLCLFLAWAALMLSIFCGIKTISAIVKSRLNSNVEWSEGKGKQFAQWCHYSFLAGIGLFAIFAFLSFAFFRPKEAEVITIRVNDPRLIQMLKDAAQRGQSAQAVQLGPKQHIEASPAKK